MSVQKLKIFKKLKGEPYSKNPILDSLIKQKLQSQMVIIKDNFNTLIHRQQARQKQIQQKPTKKRRLSTHNLASITSQKIRESINYHHQPDKEVLQFVINRQKESPFLQKSQIDSINLARVNFDDVATKMKQSDKVHYQTFGINNSKLDNNYHQHLTERLKKIVPNDIWLPQLPQVQQIITAKSDIQLSPLKLTNTLKISLTHRPSSHSFEPLKGSRNKLLKNSFVVAQSQITYDPNRYHKSDYSSLQKWFQNSIELIHKKHEKYLTTSKQTIEQQIKNHLNGIYAVYVSTIKEIIRLTYIQSGQKGLLMEKVIWSLMRLFQELIQQQHKQNYQSFKASSKQINDLRQLYEERMQKLQNLIEQKDETISKFNQTKKNIVMSCLTFRKVNQEMNDEIQVIMKEINSLSHQNDYLMSNLNKLISQFQKREIIKIQKQQSFNLYYYLNQKNQIEVVAKVPKEQLLQKYFGTEMKKASIHNIQESLQTKTNKIDKLQNELTSFWLKKRNYLEVDRIIQENFVSGINQVGIQAQPNGPNQYIDHTTQFPQSNQQTFQDFLKRQITQQRQTWSKKEVQLKQVTISLKQLYDQARQSILFLSSQNVTLKQAIDQKDHQITYLKRKVEQVDQKASLYSKKVVILEKDLEAVKAEDVKLRSEITKLNQKFNEEKKKVSFQRQNNNLLVNSNYQLKDKCDQQQKLFEQLEQKIKILAPHLQQMMALAQSSQNAILLKLSSLIQTHLSKYVQKDAQVFLTH